MGAIGPGIDLALRQRRAGAPPPPAFSPAELFAGGEQGGWYDPSDLSSMFQDSGGTVPAAVGSPVGRIQDKSGRSNHLTQAAAAARPVLRQDGSGRLYLEFDGADDHLFRAGASIHAAGAGTVAAAVRGAAQSDRRIFAEGNGSSINPVYGLTSGTSAPGAIYLFYRNDASGSVMGEAAASKLAGLLDGTNKVFVLDDSGEVARLRANGGAWQSQAYVRSASTFDRTSLGCLLRTSASSFFAGRCYGLLCVGRRLSDAELAKAEAYLAAKAGLAL